MNADLYFYLNDVYFKPKKQKIERIVFDRQTGEGKKETDSMTDTKRRWQRKKERKKNDPTKLFIIYEKLTFWNFGKCTVIKF